MKNKTFSTLVQHKYGITYGFMPKPCSTCLASYGEKCNNLQLCLKVLMICSTPEKSYTFLVLISHSIISSSADSFTQ